MWNHLLPVKSHKIYETSASPRYTPLSFCFPQTYLAGSFGSRDQDLLCQAGLSWNTPTSECLNSLLRLTQTQVPSVVFAAVKPSMPTALSWKSQRPPLVLLCINTPVHFLALEEASCHSIDPAADFEPICSPFFWLTVKARSCLSRSPRIHKTYYYCLLFGSLWLL